LQEEKLDANPKEKGNGRQKNPPRQQTLSKPFLLPRPKSTRIFFKTTTHCMKRSASHTYLVRIHVARAPRIFPSNDLFSLSLSLSLSLCLLIDRSLDRAVAAEDCRGRTTVTNTTAESKEEAKGKGGEGPNSFSAVDFGPLD